MYLLDTNVVINFLDASLPKSSMQFLGRVIDEKCNVSIITKMEALGYRFKAAEEQTLMEGFFDGSSVFAIDNDIVDQTISLRRNTRIDLPDAIIAATAIVKNLTLVTRNTKDFKQIPGLQLLDPTMSM
jgi:predicted nucleic acid-binding protein